MVSDYYTTVTKNVEQSAQEPTRFLSQFTGRMELHANTQTVTKYLNTHRDWFCRCAHPMKAESLGDHGYTLTIGRLSSFGYEIEPKISLDLLPHAQGGYRIRTIPTFDPRSQGYEVDFQAALELVETSINLEDEIAGVPQPQLTQVERNQIFEITIKFQK